MEEQQATALAVRFYQRDMPHEYESDQKGRPVSYMADFVRIEVPGNNLSIIDTFANEDHKRRFPIEWARYMNDKQNADVSGTLLKDWPILTASQASELKYYKFYTVEQVAAASDMQIGQIGMLVGMSPMSFREKAKAFLAQAQDAALVQHQADAMLQLQQQIDALKAENAQLAKTAEKRGPGRPPKNEAETEA